MDGLRTEGCGQQKQSNDPCNNQHNPQYANYWAPWHANGTARHIQHSPRHTNDWAPRTRKRHQQEHRPLRPTECIDPTQHAKDQDGGARTGRPCVWSSVLTFFFFCELQLPLGSFDMPRYRGGGRFAGRQFRGKVAKFKGVGWGACPGASQPAHPGHAPQPPSHELCASGCCRRGSSYHPIYTEIVTCSSHAHGLGSSMWSPRLLCKGLAMESPSPNRLMHTLTCKSMLHSEGHATWAVPSACRASGRRLRGAAPLPKFSAATYSPYKVPPPPPVPCI